MSILRRALIRAVLVWTIPAAWMVSTRVIAVTQGLTEYTYLAP